MTLRIYVRTSVYKCKYVYQDLHKHAPTYMRAQVCLRLYKFAYMSVYMNTGTRVDTYVCIYVYVYMHTRVRIYTYIYTYIRVYVCTTVLICLYICRGVGVLVYEFVHACVLNVYVYLFLFDGVCVYMFLCYSVSVLSALRIDVFMCVFVRSMLERDIRPHLSHRQPAARPQPATWKPPPRAPRPGSTTRAIHRPTAASPPWA